MAFRIIKIISLIVFIGLLVVTSIYSLKYMHWSTKSAGYPGLYKQTESYPFKSISSSLEKAEWIEIAHDIIGDGDITNWPDADRLYRYNTQDTLWLRFSLHNNLDINEPMVSLAFEDVKGKNWYGTVKNFTYGDMITAGYYRNENDYYGYNFIADSNGSCTLFYDLETNSLFLALPKKLITKFRNKRFVASVGFKGLWNDDFDSENFLVFPVD